jgi:hypothetical protein
MSQIITQGYGAGAGAAGLTLSTLTPNNIVLGLVFSDNVQLIGPAANLSNWVITVVGGVAVSVTGVTASGPNVTINTTPHTSGAAYTLTVPVGVVSTTNGSSYLAPTANAYTGNGAGPGISSASPMDARTLQIVFNEPVLVGDATNPASYTITPTLQVLGATFQTSTSYVLTTSRQTPGTTYTIVSTVRSIYYT